MSKDAILRAKAGQARFDARLARRTVNHGSPNFERCWIGIEHHVE